MLIDLPKDVTSAKCTAPFVDEVNLPGYHVPGRAAPDLLKKTAALLSRSKRPVLYVGHGSVISGAGKAIYQLAEKLQAPVVNTLLGKGAVAEDKPLHLGMLGMHGTAYANKAVTDCDLIMAIGARWDDRITGKLSRVLPRRRQDPHRHRPGRVQQDHPPATSAWRATPAWWSRTCCRWSTSATPASG